MVRSTEHRKRQRGFAAMDEEKRREIARKGGKAAQDKGTAHRFTSAEASEAGRKGGQASHEKRAAMRIASNGDGDHHEPTGETANQRS